MRQRELLFFVSFMLLAASSLSARGSDAVMEPAMVSIIGGEYFMGGNDPDSSSDEKPVHDVRLNNFKLAKFEVTVGQFLQFVKKSGYQMDNHCWYFNTDGVGDDTNSWDSAVFAPSDLHPVSCVSWADAKAYVAWLAKETGKPYRLPSEAEWEYAARAGTRSQYSFGENPAEMCLYGNGFDKSGSIVVLRDSGGLYQSQSLECDDHVGNTAKVGSYLPNAFGLFDMHGNVSEWVEDCYHQSYKDAPVDGKPWNAGECKSRVARGGSWFSKAAKLRVSYRDSGMPNAAGSFHGFRVAEGAIAGNVVESGAKVIGKLPSINAEVVDETEDMDGLIVQTRVVPKASSLSVRAKNGAQIKVVEPIMVTLRAGEFDMGSDDEDSSSDEKPVHRVKVSGFKLSAYEVTVGEFRQFMLATGYDMGSRCWHFTKDGFSESGMNWSAPQFAPSDAHPVTCISWFDAKAYAIWLAEQTGKKYRLPSEAEWEFAARAGANTIYSFGDNTLDMCRYANGFDQKGANTVMKESGKDYRRTALQCDDGNDYTSKVGSYKSNAFGLFDMHGNVWEWVEDCYHDSYVNAPSDGKVWESRVCKSFVARGGSWFSKDVTLRASYRNSGTPKSRDMFHGFRVAEDL